MGGWDNNLALQRISYVIKASFAIEDLVATCHCLRVSLASSQLLGSRLLRVALR